MTEISQWLKDFTEGDDKTLQEVYDELYPKVRSLLKSKGVNVEDSFELFQETICIVWQKCVEQSFMPASKNELHAYLMQVVKNKWVDRYRSKERQIKSKEMLVPSNTIFEESVHQEPENEILLKRHWKELGENCKEILRLYYFKNMSFEEMARLMPYSADSLKTMKYRCINRLKKLFAADE